MGGDHHHVKTPKVPDPSIYKVEDSEYLMKLQTKLAEKGLKDPWIRNHVWRCHLNKGLPKKAFFPLFDMFTYKWQYWVPLVGLTIAIESFLGIDYSAHGHGHGHGHEEGHDKHH